MASHIELPRYVKLDERKKADIISGVQDTIGQLCNELRGSKPKNQKSSKPKSGTMIKDNQLHAENTEPKNDEPNVTATETEGILKFIFTKNV